MRILQILDTLRHSSKQKISCFFLANKSHLASFLQIIDILREILQFIWFVESFLQKIDVLKILANNTYLAKILQIKVICQSSWKQQVSFYVPANRSYVAGILHILDNLQDSCRKEITCDIFANKGYLAKVLANNWKLVFFLQIRVILQDSCKK